MVPSTFLPLKSIRKIRFRTSEQYWDRLCLMSTSLEHFKLKLNVVIYCAITLSSHAHFINFLFLEWVCVLCYWNKCVKDHCRGQRSQNGYCLASLSWCTTSSFGGLTLHDNLPAPHCNTCVTWFNIITIDVENHFRYYHLCHKGSKPFPFNTSFTF